MGGNLVKKLSDPRVAAQLVIFIIVIVVLMIKYNSVRKVLVIYECMDVLSYDYILIAVFMNSLYHIAACKHY